MVNFTKKVFGLAGAATLFAGMAFGQATCGAPTSTTNIIRAEGTTEQVASLVITCATGAGGSSASGTGTLQVFLSPSLPVTSKLLESSSSKTEAIAVSGGATVNGTVSGSTINFSGITLPALGASASFTITVSNVRVNATSLSVGTGVPPAISETAFISGSAGSVVPAALASTQVAFAQNGLSTSVIYKNFKMTANGSFPQGYSDSTGTNNFVICNPYSPKIDKVNYSTLVKDAAAGKSLAFAVLVGENFASSFKDVAGESSAVANTVSGTSNAVADGTRLTVNFANVPSGVTLYVPSGAILSSQGAARIQLTASAAGTAFAAVTASTSSSLDSANTGLTGAQGLAAVTVAGGAGSAQFEVVTADANNLDKFYIPVFIVTTANSVPGSATAITTSVSFSPTGSTVIPNFVVGASTTTLTGSTFNTCSTSLLFPFVTNQLGFDTGIAIANTSSDPFGSAGATAQAGTCSLNFYGAGAPSPANVTTPNVPTGTVYTQVLSGVAAGFQGYIIAQCNFQYAHGFAFVTNGVGANGGLSQGYLAGVIPDVNQVNRATGTGESLAN